MKVIPRPPPRHLADRFHSVTVDSALEVLAGEAYNVVGEGGEGGQEEDEEALDEELLEEALTLLAGIHAKHQDHIAKM
jgi:hypothetical protein